MAKRRIFQTPISYVWLIFLVPLDFSDFLRLPAQLLKFQNTPFHYLLLSLASNYVNNELKMTFLLISSERNMCNTRGE